MRVAYFCTSGTMSLLPLQALLGSTHLVAIVRSARRAPLGRRMLGSVARRLGLRAVDPIDRLASAQRIPVLRAFSGGDAKLIARLRLLQPDLICISTFHWLLAPEIFCLPTYGTVNLHPSLLPRHRGPVPLFWIYYHNDHETGVTLHQVTQRADAGAILAQTCFPLPRGLSVDCLNQRNARQGAALLAQTIPTILRGGCAGRAQDETLATYAPRVTPGRSMVPYATWEVERVWHFLAGLWPRFREPVLTEAGVALPYGRVLGYRREPHASPLGSVRPRSYGWDLACLHGWVHLAAPGTS